MVSTHNPFRTPAVTPTPTGVSTATPSPTGNPDHAQTSGSSPPRLPQEIAARSSTPEDRSMNELLTQEFPPAYSPAPNVYEGEATLELGPRRPFQSAVPVPPQNRQGWVVPQQTAGSWTAFPGSMQRESANIYTRPAPPPVHPSMQGRGPISSPVSDGPSPSLSDFARDFYAAGAADVNAGVLGGPSAQYQGESPGASSSSRYAPPPGPPPTRGTKSGPTSPTSPMREQVPDDGRPTDKPVPGHPLMRHGKVLVYPKDHECRKCNNTGYKNYDPSHPCSRCWDKYAKPYTGPMAYAPWGADGQSGSGPSAARTAFQRPLPQFRAPQSSLYQQSTSFSGMSASRADLGRSSSTSRVGSGYPGAASRVIPIAGGGLPMNSYLDPLQGRGRTVFPPPSWNASPPIVPVNGAPPRSGNVTVYSPGDPRIGGRLCWRCGGDGKTSFLIFDEETCRVCNGVGRTFV